jgi:two-component system, NtrC family, sensor kinase
MDTPAQDLQSCRAELTRLREGQTATREILALVAQVQVDAQPVFDRIAVAALRLCDASGANVATFDGRLLHLLAQAQSGRADSEEPDTLEVVRAMFPRPPGPELALTRAVQTGRRVVVPDVHADPQYAREVARGTRSFSVIGIPMLRDGAPIGAIAVGRSALGPFPDEQVALLQTFADQAAIAIENARLFRDLQSRTRELEDALERQSATSQVLSAISRSPTELAPVLDTIIKTATRLVGADHSGILLLRDGKFVLAAAHGAPPEFVEFLKKSPPAVDEGTLSGRTVLERRTVYIEDARTDPRYRWREAPTIGNYRSTLGAPLLRQGEPIGVLWVAHQTVRAFTPEQVALITTFADQAVIAIENVRLFNELEQRNREVSAALEQQTATSEILRVISRSPTDVQPVFDAIAKAALALCRARSAYMLTFDGSVLHLAAQALAVPDGMDEASEVFPRPAGADTAAGRAVLTRRVAAIPDVLADSGYADAARLVAQVTGARSFLGVPLLRDDSPIGAIAVGRPEPGPIPEQQIALLQTFADQAVIAIENVRLFNELREKGLQLELASRHKSQFLANMSHELRTPLNAIIGFTRIVMRRAKGELEPKQYENLEKILASGQHLLALINALLDLSKIEAGHVEVRAAEIELRPVLEQCLLTVEPLLRSEAVALAVDVDAALPRAVVDEEKLRQIVINLLSNAAKFTERGSIRLRAAAADGRMTITVADTGIGIPADKVELVFEEFEQADASSTRQYGGTGLGLAIARRLARLMGGDVAAESAAGSGSTFTLTLPLRYRPPAEAMQ